MSALFGLFNSVISVHDDVLLGVDNLSEVPTVIVADANARNNAKSGRMYSSFLGLLHRTGLGERQESVDAIECRWMYLSWYSVCFNFSEV